MRLRAGIGLLLLGLGACAHAPDHIRVEIDGGTVEIRKKPADAEAADEAPR